MTISLAFLAPDLVKAAIDGRLPLGMGVARLADPTFKPSGTQRYLKVIKSVRLRVEALFFKGSFVARAARDCQSHGLRIRH
jgi:hypothetical protein